MWRDDAAELPGARAGCVPNGDGCPRRCGDQGVQGKTTRTSPTRYSAIPARLVGREQEIEVGRCPGDRTIYWLEKRGLKPSEEMVDRIFTRAKASSTVLTEEEIRSLLNADC